jgi:hypothetical protein
MIPSPPHLGASKKLFPPAFGDIPGVLNPTLGRKNLRLLSAGILSRISLFSLLAITPSFADFSENRGVNATLEEGYGARHRAQGLEFGGWQTGADAVTLSPAGMNDVPDFTFSTSHSERFGRANYDHFSLLTPLSTTTSLGLGLSRFGVSQIEFHSVQEANPNFSETFSVADYAFAVAYARSLGPLDFGGVLHTVMRSLDQYGLGMRGDLMTSYSTDRFRATVLWKGALPSSARWESNYLEYAPSDVLLSLGIRGNSPYFYGRYQLVWESPGLFQIESRNAYRTTTSRAYEDPITALKDSHWGGEFAFDFGLSLRAGIIGLPQSGLPEPRLGAGYSYHGWVGFDYAFVPHSELGASHYLSLSWTPTFPKFQGKNFRMGLKKFSETDGASKNSDPGLKGINPSPEDASDEEKGSEVLPPAPAAPLEEVLED